ncbi:MAG TPA: hypothetical protein VH062_35140 [Polyangiaceae bacterium]|nr:hypothetical protein [Polyangiaceae bacterium]
MAAVLFLSACASTPPVVTVPPPTLAASKTPRADADVVFRAIDLHNAAAFLAEVFGRTVVVTAKSTGCFTFETSSRSVNDAFADLAAATRTRVHETNGILVVTDINAPAPALIHQMQGADTTFDEQRWMDSGDEAFKHLELSLQGGDRVPGRVSIFAHRASAHVLGSVLIAESHTELQGAEPPSVVRSRGFGYVGEKPPVFFEGCSVTPVPEGAVLACTRLPEIDVRAARVGGEHPLAMLFTKRFDASAVYLSSTTASVGALIGLESEHRIKAIDRSGIRLVPEPPDKKPYEDVEVIDFPTAKGSTCALVEVKSEMP